jgi:hypothetical protein
MSNITTDWESFVYWGVHEGTWHTHTQRGLYSLYFVRNTWLASSLQQIQAWSKLFSSGFWHLIMTCQDMVIYVSGHNVKVLCVLSAASVPRMHLNQNTFLGISIIMFIETLLWKFELLLSCHATFLKIER